MVLGKQPKGPFQKYQTSGQSLHQNLIKEHMKDKTNLTLSSIKWPTEVGMLLKLKLSD